MLLAGAEPETRYPLHTFSIVRVQLPLKLPRPHILPGRIYFNIESLLWKRNIGHLRKKFRKK